MTENYVILLNQEIPMPRNIKSNETKKEYKEYLRQYAVEFFPERERKDFIDKKSYVSYLIEYDFELDFLVKKLYKTANKFYRNDKWYQKMNNWCFNKFVEVMDIGYYDEEDEIVEDEEPEEDIDANIDDDDLDDNDDDLEDLAVLDEDELDSEE